MRFHGPTSGRADALPLADVPPMPRLALPAFPALHEIPNLIPASLGHWLAARVGMSHAYEVFCDHCPDRDFWPAPATEEA